MPAIVGFVKWCKWTEVKLLFLRGLTFEPALVALSEAFLAAQVSIISTVSFEEEDDDVRMSNKLKQIQDLGSSQVVMAIALESTYLKIALAAQARGMVSGWAWLGLDTVEGSPNYASMERQAEANLAFNGWVFFVPQLSAGQFSAGQDFLDRVHNATQFDFPTLFDKSVLPSRYAAAMYAAITVLATVANQQRWLPTQGGRAFLNQSIGTMPFDGPTGLVKLDANGDRLLSYQAINFGFKNGTVRLTVVGSFDPETQFYSSSGAAIIWPGYALNVPVGSGSVDYSTAYVLGGSALVAIVLIGTMVYVVRRRYKKLKRLLIMASTEIARLLVQLCLETADVVTRVLSFVSVMSKQSLGPPYKIAYSVFVGLALVNGALAVGFSCRNVWLSAQHLKTMAYSQNELDVSYDARWHKLYEHEWEIQQGSREVRMHMLAVLNVFCQGASLPNRRLSRLSAPTNRPLQVCHSWLLTYV
jgi:hypothetical protein